ncbi:MAG: integrin alpha [Planctomycetota bacterium]
MNDLGDGDLFGGAVAPLGDLDGDGVRDVAVGAMRHDAGGTDRGAVWILFLNADDSVKASTKISSTSGGLVGPLADGDHFGVSLAGLGDLDGDNITDLAVGAYLADHGGVDRGAVYVLFLNANGTVKAEQVISSTAGGFGGVLDNDDRFGLSLANLSNGRLAVGTGFDDDAGPDRGAVWLVDLAANGTVTSFGKISATSGGFGGVLDDQDWFGSAVASARDLDSDGVIDLFVGARQDDDGGSNRGALWVLLLNANKTVKASTKISASSGGFTGALDNTDNFGASVCLLGDYDGDGKRDAAVGASGDDDGGLNRGAVWILHLAADGTVLGHSKLSSQVGNVTGPLADGDQFGYSIAWLDGNYGLGDALVGQRFADDGGADRGAVTSLRLSHGIWTDMRHFKSGSAGAPVLTMTGTLIPGAMVNVGVTGAAAFKSAIIAIGLNATAAPFASGVIVPSLDMLLGGFATTGAGTLSVNDRFPPNLPEGFVFYTQVWIRDQAAAFGFSLTNAVAGAMP